LPAAPSGPHPHPAGCRRRSEVRRSALFGTEHRSRSLLARPRRQARVSDGRRPTLMPTGSAPRRGKPSPRAGRPIVGRRRSEIDTIAIAEPTLYETCACRQINRRARVPNVEDSQPFQPGWRRPCVMRCCRSLRVGSISLGSLRGLSALRSRFRPALWRDHASH